MEAAPNRPIKPGINGVNSNAARGCAIVLIPIIVSDYPERDRVSDNSGKVTEYIRLAISIAVIMAPRLRAWSRDIRLASVFESRELR
jgi:hypothetical protein